jgi:addiction module HigA family antidote
MTMDEIKTPPPSVSYKTFSSLINELLLYFPARIDLSYLSDKFSINTGTQLMNAMRFLKLINDSNMPTSRLRLLVSGTTEEHRAILLRQVANDAYAFVLRGILDTRNATYAELEEIFQVTYQMKSEVCHKCIKFFVEFSNDAGIPLSPQFSQESQKKNTSPGTKNTDQKLDTKYAMCSFPKIAPGAYLKEELAARDISRAEFAVRMGMSLNEIDEIIKGNRTITAEKALQLEQALPAFPARFWLYLQSDFQLSQALVAKHPVK